MNDTVSYGIETKVRKASKPSFNYNFDFGNILSRAIDISKKDIGSWAVFNLVYILIAVLLGITIVGWLALPALAFGYTYATRKAMKGGKVETGDLFKGFDHFAKLLGIGLLFFGLMLLIMIPFWGIMAGMGIYGQEMNEETVGALYGTMMLFYLPFMLLIYLVQALFFFAPHFGVYGNMKPVAAFKASYNFAKKKMWWWLLLLVLAGIIGSLGVMACIIGVIFTIHFSQVALSSAFFDIVDKNESNLTENIDETFT